MIFDIAISNRSFVFSQSSVQISADCLTNLNGLAVAAFDLINCSLSVACFAESLSLTFVNNCRKVVIGLSATRML